MLQRIVAAVLVLAGAAIAGDARADLLIRIDKSSQQMTVSLKGETRHVWPVSTGRAGFGTPTGEFRPQWMARSWFSRKYYNAPMPHSIFFHRGYAIHGTSEIGRLGGPASHGCVRLGPANAAALFALVNAHGMKSTRIEVVGSNPVMVAGRPAARAAKALKSVKAEPSAAVAAANAPAAPAVAETVSGASASAAASPEEPVAVRKRLPRAASASVAATQARPSGARQSAARPAAVRQRAARRAAVAQARSRQTRAHEARVTPARVTPARVTPARVTPARVAAARASAAPAARRPEPVRAAAPHQVYYVHTATGTEIRYWSR